jgi:hypothetical protein
MRERNGVQLGQRVHDLDGQYVGRVKRLYDWGFEIARGFPILFRRGTVARYDEARDARDGRLVLARSRHDLFDLAAGDVPRSWRIDVPHHAGPPSQSNWPAPDAR